ncbi:MAG: radical SAM protein [Candidatus Omnitrophota bacterium]
MSYVKFGKLLRNSLDIMGVYDGEYAYKGPDCVQIDLTNDCNNNCIACWCNSPLLGDKATAKDIKEKSLDYKLVIKLIDKLFSMGTRELYFSGGGEPCMHPKLFEIMSHAKNRGFTCHLHTNFTLIDEKKINALLEMKLDYLVISLWAATPQTYVLTHPNRSEENFLRLTEFLKLLNKSKQTFPKVRIYNVISNINYREIIKMTDFILETTCDEVEFTVVDTIPGRTDRLLLSKEESAELLSMCKQIKDNGMYYTATNKFIVSNFDNFIRRATSQESREGLYDTALKDMPCYVGWLFARVLADGNVNSCLKSHRFPIGNLYQEEFDSIWNNSKQRYFRKNVTKSKNATSIFTLIGNDPDKEIGCYKSCDDLGRNRIMQAKLSRLNNCQRSILKSAVNIKRLGRALLRKC